MIRGLQFFLCIVFVGSFSAYLFPLSEASLIVPVAAYIFLGALSAAVWLGQPKHSRESFITGEVAWILLALPVVSAVPSFLSELNLETSRMYWFLITCILWASRAITLVLGVRRNLAAFYYAGIICIAIAIVDGYDLFMSAAISFERIALRSFHYNLLGFSLAGFFAASIASSIVGNQKKGAIAVAAVSAIGIFLTSSRGALVSILIGLTFLSVALLLRKIGKRKRLLRQVIFVSGLMVPIVGIVVLGIMLDANVGNGLLAIWNYVDRALDITSPYRGISSGFSGRTDSWGLILRKLANGTWLWGEGYRAGNAIDFPIDNGYLVLLFELGIFPFLVVLIRYLTVFRQSIKLGMSAEQSESRLGLGISVVLTVFFFNNIVARYLFGIGNPFSLFALLFLVTTKRAILLNSEETKGTCQQ